MKRFVYHCYDKNDLLLYVGSTMFPHIRIDGHRVSSKWFDNVKTIKIRNFPTKEKGLAFERKSIEADKPLYNVVGTPRLAALRAKNKLKAQE